MAKIESLIGNAVITGKFVRVGGDIFVGPVNTRHSNILNLEQGVERIY